MSTARKNTTMVGVSELRAGIASVLEKTRDGVVVIEKRHKPKAVLMSSEEYERIQNVLDAAEDLVLGFIAEERSSGCRSDEYIDIETLL